jgi:hypothetical protein
MRKKNWSRVPDGCLTPRLTGRLTVGRNVTSTSTSESSQNGSHHLQNRGYDNVLPVHGYLTPRRTVIDEREAMVEL